MRTKIDTNEVQRILEMHSKVKKSIILEQVDADNEIDPKLTGNSPVVPEVNKDEIDRKLIDDAITAGCLKNGKVRFLKGTKSPVYQATTLKTNTVVTFYPNMTYKLATGETGKWKCSKAELAAKEATQVASQKTTVDTDLARELSQYGWKERKNIDVTDIELSQLYQKHPKYNLYKLKVNTAKQGGYTPEQTAFIENWKGKGYKSTLTPEELAMGTFQKVNVQGSEQYFPGGLIMYKPAAGAQDKKICRDKVKQYYDYWKTKREDISQSEFDQLKSQVQACANQFEGKWGGIFSSVDNYIKTLRGGTGGPLSYGEDAKWRLK
jgi:hypothetical protein